MAVTDNYSKILFSSLFNYQKEAIVGSGNFALAALSNTTITIPHNLGYVPTARVWYEPYFNSAPSNQIWPLAGYQYGDLASNTLNHVGYAYLDSTNLYIVINSSTAVTIPVYWRIYYDA